jgi:hypothetical protein
MPPSDDAPPCRRCMDEPADEDGFCSDACYHLYQEELRKENSDAGTG